MKIYTIKDIAQLAGVSVTTVSRVLNHRPDVNRATREKVEKIMAEVHFVGNASARSLKQADGDAVAIILRGRENPFLNSLVEAFLRYGQYSGISYLVEYIDEKDDEFRTALRLLQEKRVKGFLFVGSRIDERAQVLRQTDCPMVFATVSAQAADLPRAASVCIDERTMARQAVSALIERGRQRIVIFGGSPNEGDNLSLRNAGAMDALREASLPSESACVVETRFSLRDAYAAAHAFFTSHKDVTGAFCMSDTVAMGVIRALQDMGLRVPEDVSVFGFDGIDIGDYFIPRLSTVEQPVEDIARESIRVLTDMLKNNAPSQHITVDATLKLRESI